VFVLVVQAVEGKEEDAPTITSQAMVERGLEPSESPNFMGYVPVAPFSCRLFNRSKTDALGIVIIRAKRTFVIGAPWGCGPVSTVSKSGSYFACCPTTLTSFGIATECISKSTLVVDAAHSYTWYYLSLAQLLSFER
jgi:hypothetical protein